MSSYNNHSTQPSEEAAETGSVTHSSNYASGSASTSYPTESTGIAFPAESASSSYLPGHQDLGFPTGGAFPNSYHAGSASSSYLPAPHSLDLPADGSFHNSYGTTSASSRSQVASYPATSFNAALTPARPSAASGTVVTGFTPKSDLYAQLVDKNKHFVFPITDHATLHLYNEAYLAKNNAAVIWPVDLPRNSQQRQAEANKYLQAFTCFDPAVEYPVDQACGELGRRGTCRFDPAEMALRSWDLQEATENASKGVCKIPETEGSKFPKYARFNTHGERVDYCARILERNKKAVLNIMTNLEYRARFPWNPKAEITRIEQNEKSAASKKKRFQPASTVVRADEENSGDDHSPPGPAQIEPPKKRARTRRSQKVANAARVDRGQGSRGNAGNGRQAKG
ncbi:hypothetical protein GGR57DRAFT_503980 [Xylariaceae sp. FL1272]|nr:hypothetical protein GGR57DRAFT_503980 [Xylariaceae sp. FL1272]